MTTNGDTRIRPLALGLTALGVLLRLIPHPMNFAPVGAVSLFGGARLRGAQAYLVPLALMVISDSIMGLILGYGAFNIVTPFVYASFLVNVWIGRRLRATTQAPRIAGAALLGSLQFFVVTNFGVWAAGITYPGTAVGLAACYAGGLPFLGRTLASDLMYSGVLFGLHAWLTHRLFQGERVAPQAATA